MTDDEAPGRGAELRAPRRRGRGRDRPALRPQTRQGGVIEPSPVTALPPFTSPSLSADVRQDTWQVSLDPQSEAGGLGSEVT